MKKTSNFLKYEKKKFKTNYGYKTPSIFLIKHTWFAN
jgi:hypothetical protein